MIEFAKKYNFKESEKQLQDFWHKIGVYKWKNNSSRKKTYVVDTPPPTVSGQLHIGHVYSYTQTDFIVRFKRMMGYDTFYPIGFDDNGLPTERLVEKKKKIKASGMDREEFIQICKEIVKEEEDKFRELFNSIALSVDWDLEYQTISPTSRKISQLSFLDLVNKGQAYRMSQPILWDPVDQTALSQADIEDKERKSYMNNITFSLLDNQDNIMKENLVIATTRPELLAACVAVFFHPDDERYKHLSGKYALTPLFDLKIPIIADDIVKPDKGTGLVMCCTFGDQTDIVWWRKHNLPYKVIINKYGKMVEADFGENCLDQEKANYNYSELTSLKVQDAREKVVNLLQDNGHLLSREEIDQTVKCAERSGAPLEIITTPQWFIKTIEHKEALLQRANELKWHPESMKIKLESWINSISWDWCISRQRYFGVPFPVWYSKRIGEEGKAIFADPSQLPVDPLQDLPKGYTREEVVADMDVMDTWSTSSVSPQLNSRGISDDLFVDQIRHKKLFPADLRPQAHEILRTWAFYTILKAHIHENTLPWKNIMISGWCLAEDKTKMSKSKGNIIAPETLLENYGSDVVRYWSSNSRLGADTAYSEDIMKNGKRLINKLWNSAKFASQHINKINPADLLVKDSSTETLEIIASKKTVEFEKLASCISSDYDKFFIDSLSKLIQSVTESYLNYDYAAAIEKTEKFFWEDFCDNYLEITKTRAYNEDEDSALRMMSSEERKKGQISAILTLRYALDVILKLFAPILPHITEEIYQLIYQKDSNSIRSVHETGGWPKLDSEALNIQGDSILGSKCLIDVLDLVRKAKASQGISIKAPIECLEIKLNDNLMNSQKNLKNDIISKSLMIDLMNVTSSKQINIVDVLSSDNMLSTGYLSVNIVFAKAVSE